MKMCGIFSLFSDEIPSTPPSLLQVVMRGCTLIGIAEL